MYLIFDTETTGLPKRWGVPISDTDNWPRCIQIAWQLPPTRWEKSSSTRIIWLSPKASTFPYDAERIHGISTELAQAEGIPLADVLEKFNLALSKAKFIVGQNLGFDVNIIGLRILQNGSRKSDGFDANFGYLYRGHRFLVEIARRSWWEIQIAHL